MSTSLGINFYYKEKPDKEFIKKFVKLIINSGFDFTIAKMKKTSLKYLDKAIDIISSDEDSVWLSFNYDAKRVKETGADFTPLTISLRVFRDSNLYNIYIYATDFSYDVFFEYPNKMMNRAFIIALLKKLYKWTKPLYIYMQFEDFYGVSEIAQLVKSSINDNETIERSTIEEMKTPFVTILSKEFIKEIGKPKFENAKIEKLDDGGMLIIANRFLENEN